jgi:hypothetical protein
MGFARGILLKKVKTISMATSISNSEFTQLAPAEQIAKTVQALEAHGMRAVVFESGEEARSYVLDLIPKGAEVYNSPSRTLELIGLAEDIEHPTSFQSVRARLLSLDRVTQRTEMRKLDANPDVLVGSVHAITEQGEIMVASRLCWSSNSLDSSTCGRARGAYSWKRVIRWRPVNAPFAVAVSQTGL